MFETRPARGALLDAVKILCYYVNSLSNLLEVCRVEQNPRPISGWLERIADVLMLPIMYIISGTFSEAPQKTHRWNNTKLKSEQVAHLKDDMKVFCEGIKSARVRFWLKIPFFHIPLLGGWKDYVVLQPVDCDREWHIGWLAHDVAGVSRIKVRGPVRLLLGPGDVSFFGINSEGGQLKLQEISRGRIGDGGEYSKTPLL